MLLAACRRDAEKTLVYYNVGIRFSITCTELRLRLFRVFTFLTCVDVNPEENQDNIEIVSIAALRESRSMLRQLDEHVADTNIQSEALSSPCLNPDFRRSANFVDRRARQARYNALQGGG
jgi:hypothetical protein